MLLPWKIQYQLSTIKSKTLKEGAGINHCNKQQSNNREIMHWQIYLMVRKHHSWVLHKESARFNPYFGLCYTFIFCQNLVAFNSICIFPSSDDSKRSANDFYLVTFLIITVINHFLDSYSLTLLLLGKLDILKCKAQ